MPQNGAYLDSCVSLGDDCCYSASENDSVYLIREDDGLLSSPSEEIAEDTVKNGSADITTEFIMELQVLLHTCSCSSEINALLS